MKKLGLAFAGFRHGHIFGMYNLAAKKEYIDIAGVWENNPEAVIEMREKGIDVSFANYQSLLQDSAVDAVAIGDCYGVRGKMAIEALNAGKHVIADKPLCTSIEELNEIRRISTQKALKIGIMLDLRINGNVNTALELIRNGRIGIVNNINFSGQHPLLYGKRPAWYFEKGMHGGVINDIAIHGIDLVRLMTGCNLRRTVGARCWNFYAGSQPEFLDSAQFILEMENGAGICADVSYAAPDSHGYILPTYWNFEIWGNGGMLCFNLASKAVTLYAKGASEPEQVPQSKAKSDYLDDFYNDINGCSYKYSLCTADILKTSEQTLQIQHCADEVYITRNNL